MVLTEWVAFTGAVTGVAGMVLGIISTINVLRMNRVRLRVVPKLGVANAAGLAFVSDRAPGADGLLRVGQRPELIAVEIVNLSAFPVTISDVGLGTPDRARASFIVPDVSPGYTWPPVVESRRAVTVYQRLNSFPGNNQLPNNVYVKTECGTVKKARSDALDWLFSCVGSELRTTNSGTAARGADAV